MRYSSNDGRYAVELDEKVMLHIVEYIGLAGKKETGGVVFGKYNLARDCATVGMITGPPSDSKSGHAWFVRGINGLQLLVSQLWKKKQYYLGEWHFHPYALPSPSGTDIRQMVEIARSKEFNCPEPVLLIIGGNAETHDVRIFIVLPNKNVVELHKRCEE